MSQAAHKKPEEKEEEEEKAEAEFENRRCSTLRFGHKTMLTFKKVFNSSVFKTKQSYTIFFFKTSSVKKKTLRTFALLKALLATVEFFTSCCVHILHLPDSTDAIVSIYFCLCC